MDKETTVESESEKYPHHNEDGSVNKDMLSKAMKAAEDNHDEAMVSHMKAHAKEMGMSESVAEASNQDELKQAQEKRSSKYGIRIHSNTHVTKPSEWSSLSDDEFGDPVNYKYPIHDKAHADNANARLEQNKGDYNDKEYNFVLGRIVAAQRKFGSKSQAKEAFVPSDALTRRIHTDVVVEQMMDSVGKAWMVRLIKPGFTVNGRRNYRQEALDAAVSLYDGVPCYVDHQMTEGNKPSGARSLHDKVGWISDSYRGIDGAVYGRLNVLESSGQNWFPQMLRECQQRGALHMVQLSQEAEVAYKLAKEGNRSYEDVLKIIGVHSVDAVSAANAGGAFVSQVQEELKLEEELNNMDIKEMSLDELKELRPDLFKSVSEDSTDKKSDEDIKAVREAITRLEANQTRMVVESAIRGSGLPNAIQDKLVGQYDRGMLPATAVEDTIKTEREIVAALKAEYTPTTMGGFTPEDVHPMLRVGKDNATKAAEFLMDKLVGKKTSEYSESELKAFPRTMSLREAYTFLTGDWERGRANLWGTPLRSIFQTDEMREYVQEAIGGPTAAYTAGGATITMANLLSTSMNKRVIKMYRAQPRWWEPVVAKEELTDLKLQSRVLLGDLASLTNITTNGTEYTDVAWSEEVETYTPTKYGNLYFVTREAIINDDLRQIQQLPKVIAKAAGVTINEYVSALFTTGSGLGPTLNADSKTVIHADHANYGTAALNLANLQAAIIRMMKQTDSASKRLSILPKFLLVPADLTIKAEELVASPYTPETANNAVNVAPIRNLQVIMVPQWTDANNWYLMADPNEAETVVMGFLQGEEEPKFEVSDDPKSGYPFTHDAIVFKVRWYGGGQVVDYRGIDGNIV